MAIKQYSAFTPPSPYDQERRRAEQMRQYAELLQQQAMSQDEQPFTYQGFRAAPSPLTALTKMLQAYGAKKAGEKADEAEARKTGMEEQAAQQMMGRLTGAESLFGRDEQGGMTSVYEPIEKQRAQIDADIERQRASGQLEEVRPTAQYTRDPMDAARIATTGAGAGAMRGNPMLAAMLQKSMEEPKEAEYGTTPQFDAEGRAFVVNKAGNVRYLDGIKAPPKTTNLQDDYNFAVSQGYKGSFEDFRNSGIARTNVDVRYGAPVSGVDAQGNPVFFQPNPTGGPPSIIPGVSPESKGPTDTQATARLYAERMAQSEPTFENLPPPGYGARAKESLPGNIGNVMLDDEARQFFQAERNFINAVLRKESGAVISPSEFDEARKQYIPQPGDDQKTLAQKRQARATAIRQISVGAGPGYQPPIPQDTQIIVLPPRR